MQHSIQIWLYGCGVHTQHRRSSRSTHLGFLLFLLIVNKQSEKSLKIDDVFSELESIIELMNSPNTSCWSWSCEFEGDAIIPGPPLCHCLDRGHDCGQ